jgi:proline dehydrogenase
MASAWQSLMIALARSSMLTRILQGNSRIASLSSQFLGGPNEDSALRTALALRQQGIRVSMFFLGEYTTDTTTIARTVDSLIRVLTALNLHGLDSHISVDPTQIGFAIGEELGKKNALRLGASFPEQRSRHSYLMLDMEDFTYVDSTIRLRSLLASRGIPAAITLQAYLYRTESDLARLLDERIPCIRLVKGAFSEAGNVALKHRNEIFKAFMRMAELMLSDKARACGLFPVFATHDENIIHSVVQLARERGYVPGDYEFELLHGVRHELQTKIVAGGEQLRIYLPYGVHWWPYTARRIGENARNLAFVYRAIGSR